MGYLDVLHYLEGVIVDRHELSIFDEVWSSQGNDDLTLELDPTTATVFDNALKVTDMTEDDVIFVQFDDPLRLDDRLSIELHITPSEDIGVGDFTLGFSDSIMFNFMHETIDLPDIDAGNTEIVSLEIPNPEFLGAVKSIGIQCNVARTAGEIITIGRIVAKSHKFVVTVEQLESFELNDGIQFVLSKINEVTMPSGDGSDNLLVASHLAAGAYCWMYLNGQDTAQWDYGSKLATKNYAIRLLADAETKCEEYLRGGDTTIGKKLILIGGYGGLSV